MRLQIAILISIILHATAVFALIYAYGIPPEKPYGPKEYIVAIDMLNEVLPPTPHTNLQKKSDEINQKQQLLSHPQQSEKSKPLATNNDQPATSNKQQATGIGGSNKILAEIKAKIESAKRYPGIAKRMRIEGRPSVLFEINSDGSIKYVKIAASSGEDILDNAALETVKNAAPLPYYEKPIRLAIRYELRN